MRLLRVVVTARRITFVVSVATVVAWAALAESCAAQHAETETILLLDGIKGGRFSGRVIDGLGRPLSGVKITVEPYQNVKEKGRQSVLHTGDDGKYSGTLPQNHEAWLAFEREGYVRLRANATAHAEITLNRKIDWSDISTLPYRRGDDLDHGMQEVLASEEWALADDELLSFLFRHHHEFRPALRRLIDDRHVGASVRDWLDLLNDPADRDLFAKQRRYAPKETVKETDLIEALKTTARKRNFFSSAPEPLITIDFIAFTRDLDQVLIQCGINRVAMTGITWQFVFRKAGKQWELSSVKEAGRS